MAQTFDRRDFLALALSSGVGIGFSDSAIHKDKRVQPKAGKRVGIVGLDTSHSVSFTKELNQTVPNPVWQNYRVTAAYPKGSNDIESSVKRIAGYTKDVQALGVAIVNSLDELLRQVDFVLLETNDGRRHLEQATAVFKAGKRVFIDKPLAGSLADAVAIFALAEKHKIPVFSASSLRYIKGIDTIDKRQVLGADAFSPATLEKTHPDLFWYGIHGVETLFTVMGTGCQQVVRVSSPDADVVVGTWVDGRIGTFRGTRTGKHDYGGFVYTTGGNSALGSYEGYNPLLKDIIHFFETGRPPVSPEETLEIYAFMEAADESKRRGGLPVTLSEVLQKARKR